MKTIWLKLLGIGKNLRSVLQPILAREAKSALEDLLPIARDAVFEAALKKDLPNERRDYALNALKSRATDAGINVGTSVLNLAIELAVQAAKH